LSTIHALRPLIKHIGATQNAHSERQFVLRVSQVCKKEFDVKLLPSEDLRYIILEAQIILTDVFKRLLYIKPEL